MSIAEKKRGFRKIVVENKAFNWRFTSLVDIRPEGLKGNKLLVDFGWFDEWLYANDRENRPPDFEPKVITAQFVKKAIEFALLNDWNIESDNLVLNLKFHDGEFQILTA